MAKLTLTDISAGYDTATVNAANNLLIENALENTLSRDGTSPNQMEANIDMNSNYVRNMHDGVNNQDAVTVAQLNGVISGELLSVSVGTLSDVGVGTPTAGNVLVGDGDSWESTTFVASYFDSGVSTDGYVLTSDGAGNADWEAVAVLASNINSNGAADGYVLTSDGANGTAWEAVPAGGSVAGSDTQIQYNESGAFGASGNLVWDRTNSTLDVTSSSAHPHPAIGINIGDNTDKPAIEIRNSLNSSTVLIESWNYDNTASLTINHRHDISNGNLTIDLEGTQVLYLDESGHPKTRQTVTGAGLERILTTSDLASTGFTVAAGKTTTWAASSDFVSQSGATSTYNSGSTTKFDDNANLTFGTGSDVNIDFDATDFNIAGTGDLNLTGFTGVKMGDAAIPITYSAGGGNTAVNSVTDVTVATRDVTNIIAGDVIQVDVWFTILNNSGAGRAYTLTLDFDSLFDCEITTASLGASSTSAHPILMRGVLDVRSSVLSYMMVRANGRATTAQASGANVTMATGNHRAMSWGTSATDVTGTTTCSLKARSSSATATQTLRLHDFTVKRRAKTV